jgi:hypothetical protein
MPLAVLDVDDAAQRTIYGRTLVLVRPDRHVAWRGHAEPDEALDLIDLVRGARKVLAARRAMAPAAD